MGRVRNGTKERIVLEKQRRGKSNREKNIFRA